MLYLKNNGDERGKMIEIDSCGLLNDKYFFGDFNADSAIMALSLVHGI